MNDQTKRQLELAAKAMGLDLVRWNDGGEPYSSGEGFILADNRIWNPAVSNADSRQLQVALRMRVAMGTDAEGEFWTASAGEVCAVEWVGANGGNHELAVRLAVLKCAYRYACDAGIGDAP